MHCPSCGIYVGNCGHVAGGLTSPVTLSGTCGNGHKYSVTCNGGCVSNTETQKQNHTTISQSSKKKISAGSSGNDINKV